MNVEAEQIPIQIRLFYYAKFLNAFNFDVGINQVIISNDKNVQENIQ